MDTQAVEVFEIRCESFVLNNAVRNFGVPKKNENGYYTGIVLGLMDGLSQNNSCYLSKAMSEQITNPTLPFRKKVLSGKAYGEYNHPDVNHIDATTKAGKEAILRRMASVNMQFASHHFGDVYLDPKPLENGEIIIRGDIRPYGPYKECLEDSLSCPTINTAFSLRAITKLASRDQIPPSLSFLPQGTNCFIAILLAGFDAVDAGGFEIADKSHAPALEAFKFTCYDESDSDILATSVRTESFSNTELNDLFGTFNIKKVTKTVTVMKTNFNQENILSKKALKGSLLATLGV